jgi:hypothetical protein
MAGLYCFKQRGSHATADLGAAATYKTPYIVSIRDHASLTLASQHCSAAAAQTVSGCSCSSPASCVYAAELLAATESYAPVILLLEGGPGMLVVLSQRCVL